MLTPVGKKGTNHSYNSDSFTYGDLLEARLLLACSFCFSWYFFSLILFQIPFYSYPFINVTLSRFLVMLYLVKYSASMVLEKFSENYNRLALQCTQDLDKSCNYFTYWLFLVNFAQIPLWSQLCGAVLHLHWHNWI